MAPLFCEKAEKPHTANLAVYFLFKLNTPQAATIGSYIIYIILFLFSKKEDDNYNTAWKMWKTQKK